jgi:hypothetical protein
MSGEPATNTGNAQNDDSAKNGGTDRFAVDLDTINRRIDDIVAFQKRGVPWYRDTGLTISVAAFFFSIVTSSITAYRTLQQDINSRKAALQSLIQQLYTEAVDHAGNSVEYIGALRGLGQVQYSLGK